MNEVIIMPSKRNKHNKSKVAKTKDSDSDVPMHQIHTSKELLGLPPISSALRYSPSEVQQDVSTMKTSCESSFKKAAKRGQWMDDKKNGNGHHRYIRVVVMKDESGNEFYFLQKTNISSSTGKSGWIVRGDDMKRSIYYSSSSSDGEYINTCKVVAIVDSGWVTSHL